MYEIVSKPKDGDESTLHVEARRSSMMNAFRVARKLHGEYLGQVDIQVRKDGVVIASDATECTMDLRKIRKWTR